MKITYNNYRYIMNMKKKPIFIQKLLRYDLLVMDGYAKIKVSMPMWLYLLAFIPVHAFIALACVWDGGLKSFEVESREIANWTFHNGDAPYERAKEIYNN